MKTIFTCGTFDLFHVGHLNFLKKSREMGDRLIVGVNTDEFVYLYKNKNPIIPFIQRKLIVQSCKYIDWTVDAEEYLPLKYIKEFKVDIITVGSEWKTTYIESIDWALKNNIHVEYIDYTQYVSTTKIIQHIKDI